MDDRSTEILTEEQPPALSIVIPTLNEARSIEQTLDSIIRVKGDIEVIVVDCGSLDGTAEIVRRRGVKLIRSAQGRGVQMHAGARVARGKALLFLHADTHPAPDSAQRIAETLGDPNVVAGNFNVRFDGTSSAARFLSWLYPHLRKLGLAYGDSAIFVLRDVYEEIGGFRPFPIFEDLDLVRRLRKRGRFAHLPIVIVTSSRRFEGRSFALTFVKWACLQALYWMGVHPRTLGRLYAPVRKADEKLHRDDNCRQACGDSRSREGG